MRYLFINNVPNSGKNLIGFASSISIIISENLSTDDISLLASVFSAIGDNLAIIATTQSQKES